MTIDFTCFLSEIALFFLLSSSSSFFFSFFRSLSSLFSPSRFGSRRRSIRYRGPHDRLGGPSRAAPASGTDLIRLRGPSDTALLLPTGEFIVRRVPFVPLILLLRYRMARRANFSLRRAEEILQSVNRLKRRKKYNFPMCNG